MNDLEIQALLKQRVEAAFIAVSEQCIHDAKDYLGQFYAPLRLMYEGKIHSWKEWEQIKAKIDAIGVTK